MSSSSPWDGTVWGNGLPTNVEPHGNDYQEHQATKKSLEFVNNKEHESIGANPSLAAGGGVHKNGSGVAYYTSTAPTNRPDSATALGANDVDRGRIWFDTTYTPPVMKKWNGSAWVLAGNKLLNPEWLTSVNNAGDNTVSVIRANTSDLPELADGAVLLAATESGDGFQPIMTLAAWPMFGTRYNKKGKR